MAAWPSFVVGNIGTALHTTYFDPLMAHRLVGMVRPYATLVKGHYTDHVTAPADYPVLGIGGANIGPGLTEVEVEALLDVADRVRAQGGTPDIEDVLFDAVVDSGRWTKWLLSGEEDVPFERLPAERQAWLVRTGCRYVWTEPAVQEARSALYDQVEDLDAQQYVEGRLQQSIRCYLRAFNLIGFNEVVRAQLAGT
jgi:tagatose-1,6-bisphosphate aldolase non-catalytic subunit AgaZ/GatZ